MPEGGSFITAEGRLASGVSESYRSQSQQLAALLWARATPEVWSAVRDHAQGAARDLDDNHVGTEHITLAIYIESVTTQRSAHSKDSV